MSVEKEQILDLYRVHQSINKTAQILGISQATVRRVLVEGNLYQNRTSRYVLRLYRAGFSISEIQDIMQVSRNAVISYLPYTRGYRLTAHKSANAIRIARTRARKQNPSKQSWLLLNRAAFSLYRASQRFLSWFVKLSLHSF